MFTYLVLHTVLVLLQATTLNVAINSSNKALLTIMMSNNVTCFFITSSYSKVLLLLFTLTVCRVEKQCLQKVRQKQPFPAVLLRRKGKISSNHLVACCCSANHARVRLERRYGYTKNHSVTLLITLLFGKIDCGYLSPIASWLWAPKYSLTGLSMPSSRVSMRFLYMRIGTLPSAWRMIWLKRSKNT